MLDHRTERAEAPSRANMRVRRVAQGPKRGDRFSPGAYYCVVTIWVPHLHFSNVSKLILITPGRGVATPRAAGHDGVARGVRGGRC